LAVNGAFPSVEIQSDGAVSISLTEPDVQSILSKGMTFTDDFVTTLTVDSASVGTVGSYSANIASSGIDIIQLTRSAGVPTVLQARALVDANPDFDGTFQLKIDVADYGEASASFSAFAAAGIDEVAFEGGAASLTVAQMQEALGAGLAFADGDEVTL